ncbi:RNA polymerase sigma factor [Fimbriiglobus ruber]|uniref:ECF RNA polymerase sigma factor SigE n=1 Tax=Fimbriiglobus ruber TaxID=1908690 RepID=A0A225D907_9BACT|nr:RNA polymerase sigma factor [Fimbriiglobus ruber]OWK38090.1 hypothetical protein FRUB_07210 [Fimbriiglobus ruber]
MSSGSFGRLATAARRLARPPAGSDADLLARYADTRDPAAFEAVVARHGPGVLAVCRARLRNPADADDAFQATFLVLARDAARIRDGAVLAGWLHRVAHFVSLKIRRRGAVRAADPLPPDPPDPTIPEPAAAAAIAETCGMVLDELAALPDRFRAVVILCGLEGRTNAEAADILGCPRGTVDSRLSAARKKLKARLARRGVELAAAVAVERTLSDAAAAGCTGLIGPTAAAAGHYAIHGAGADPSPASLLANGVKPTMLTLTRLAAATLLAAGALGTIGWGLYHAAAQDAPPPQKPAAVAADAPKKPADKKPADKKPEVAGVPVQAQRDETAIRLELSQPCQLSAEQRDSIKFEELIEYLKQKHGIAVRLDTAAFKRLGINWQREAQGARAPDGKTFVSANLAAVGDDFQDGLRQFYQHELHFLRGLTVADVLTEAVAQLPGKCAFRLRGNQILVGPAYVPISIPGKRADDAADAVAELTRRQMVEQIVGEPVSVSVEDLPLTDVVKQLRQQTGANIVIDARCKAQSKQNVSATFDDVRLLSALQLLADMCELKPVAMNNLYYITTGENAAKLQKEILREQFGEPTGPGILVPPDAVSDGLNLYERPATLKPYQFPGGLGFGGGGGMGGRAVVPGPKPTPPEKQPEKPSEMK